jgi:UDP-glucose 4-epimerase
MRTLVAGGAGFLGSHLVDRLLAEDHTVDVVDDLSSGSLGNLTTARAGAHRRFRFHHLDVRAPELTTLMARRRPDVTYHLATTPPGAGLRQVVDVVVGGAANMLEAARCAGVAKVVITLDAMALYGPVPPGELPVRDTRPWAPRTEAGVAMRAVADLLGVARERHALEFTGLALTNVYGPRQTPGRGVVAAFAAAADAARSCTIDGDGRQTRDFLYVDDAVDAIVRAGARGTGLVVNVGTGVQTAVRDVHALIAGDAPAQKGRSRPDEVGRFAVSPVRARIHLAWSPWTTLAQGIALLREPPA